MTSGQRQLQAGAQAAQRRGIEPDLALVELRDLAHDRQPQPAAGLALVGAGAALEDPLALGRAEAGPIILDRHQQASALGTGLHRHPAMGPFAGVVEQIADDLRGYVPGWKAYFQLAQTPKVFRELDEWIRHRLRAVQLKHWRRGTTMYRELKAMGASDGDARKVAANSRRWWRNSRQAMNRAVPIAYFDRLGVPRLS